MPRATKVDKHMQAKSLLRGLGKHFPKEGKHKVGGKPRSRGELVALVQAHLDAMHEVDVARAAFRASVAKERALAKRVKAATGPIRDYVRNAFGPDLAVLADFGLKIAKKPGPKTVAAKLAGVQKRQAARDAS
jgi:hypothetical protein